MKITFFTTVLLWLSLSCSGQNKPPLSAGAFEKWPSVDGYCAINATGSFIAYAVYQHPNDHSIYDLYLQAANGKIHAVLPSSCIKGTGQFSSCGSEYLYINAGDSLVIMDLNNKGQPRSIPDVSSFEFLNGKTEQLYLSHKRDSNKLEVFPLHKQDKARTIQSEETLFLEGNRYFLTVNRMKESFGYEVQLHDAKLSKENKLPVSGRPTSFLFDTRREILLFTTQGPNEKSTTVWQYDVGGSKLFKLFSQLDISVDTGRYNLVLDRYVGGATQDQLPFTKDGRYLLLRLEEKYKLTQPASNPVIWKYSDDKLASEIKIEKTDITVIIDLRQRKTVKIFHYPFERVRAFSEYSLLVEQHSDDFSPIEVFWNTRVRSSFILYSLKTKEFRSLPIEPNFSPFPNFSPDGLHLVGFDYKQNSYASFEITTGIYRYLNKGADISYPTYDSKIIQSIRPLPKPAPIWSPQKGVFFIHDENDVWRFNLLKDDAPVCITNFFGRKNSIKFQLLEGAEFGTGTAPNLLLAFNVHDKTNGFYRWSERSGEDPFVLSSGNFVYQLPGSAWSSPAGFTPVKASACDAFLLRRMSAKESPNYFLTKDFKKIIQLSHIQPETKVNWITTELVHWKSPSGTELSGVLYKPESFDNKKKYPLIFHYYERKSDELNHYKYPDPGMGDLSIAFFVSNSYLVFCPDIDFTEKGPGIDALECIQSAVSRLSELPFIDISKLGLQGNSFGGYITNYLIGHSDSFAAACSSAGIVDLIAYSGRLTEINSGESMRDGVQFGQNRMNEMLWQNPQKYLLNSPIFNVDRIKTPLLLEYGRNDTRMYIEGVNFFTALRRLQKRAWLLDYVNAGHGPVGNDAKDYTIKMYQFFNHYLKGAPMPLWMVPSHNQ